MLFNVKERKLKLPGMEIDYITFGKGSKNLIMIQGLSTNGIKGSGLPLAYMYRIFFRDYTVYLFDRRPDIPDGFTVRDMAADVAAAMDTLGVTKADIFGVSQGGMIAQYLAIDRPDLVNKMILALTLSKNNYIVESVIKNWITLTEQGNMKQLVTDMAEKMYSDEYVRRYKPFIPLLAILQKPKDSERFIKLAKSCLSCNAYTELEKIHCPVYVIGAKKDKVLGGTASEEIAEKLSCEIYMYENLGHAAYEEAKDFNKRVLAFFMS